MPDVLPLRATRFGPSPSVITAFYFLESVALVSGQCRIPPWPGTTMLSRGVRGSCGTRPLRPPASLLLNAALPAVPTSHCAKAPLGAGHRFAPFG